MNSEVKHCQNCKQNFTIEPDDFSFYEKIKVPPPTFCPECRLQRRSVWKNNMYLCNRNCDLCQKTVVTIYSKESNRTVYCVRCWWSDKWDPKSYGKYYDFSRPFFEQFDELSREVPHMALINDDGIASVNCEYTQDLAFSKNCYMVFVAWHIENVMYSYFILAGKDIVDCMNLRSKNEFLYECVRCALSYKLIHSQSSKNCIDSAFLMDCMNCSDCFMCYGLINKKYYFKNKQYTKEEYKEILDSYSLDTFSGVEKAKKEFRDFNMQYFRRYARNFHNENVTGEEVSYSKNLKRCFSAKKCENCSYCDLVEGIKDSYDMSGGGELSECYESVTCDQSNHNMFGIYSWKNQDVTYTEHCHSSKSLFGCSGLRSSKYCILNKQYTKEEYETNVAKIIAQMNQMPYMDQKGNIYKYGEFYPIELSPFGYNETQAQEVIPLSKEQVLIQNYKWQDNIQLTKGKETLKSENIPDSIHQVDESILNEILACIDCGRNYKITPSELTFYKKMEIPIPRRCFYCRHANRLKIRNPFNLWHRSCMCDPTSPSYEGQSKSNHFHGGKKCHIEFETSYSPDRPEVVYCEKCYQAEVW